MVWGLALGVGLLLVASPWLWPTVEPSRQPRRRNGGARLRELLVQAGLVRTTPGALIAVSLVLGAAAAVLVLGLLPVVALAVAAGLAAAAIPLLVVSARARSRRRATRAVWPDALDHLVAGLRSGLPLGEALAALGETGPVLLRPAFVQLADDYRVTGQLGYALDDLKEHLADPVADRVIETVRVAREVGGTELPAVLRALAAHLRADAAIRSEVEARQTWVVSAARLGVAAPWIVLVLLAARPEAVRAYNSPLGVAVLAVGLVVTVVAYRVMLALGRLPEERRWFA
ncbi:type II secretion system F family protein [Protaetiibacter larvae]|uniref:Type II secretion system F family protein n=1 Tax=Protaetiibacter larvae TaxID=2592654 RepID=A0A5C1YDA3_9MICO|nr:type II secretion system F family protein [Protaetiibacter larvae]